MRLPAFEDLSEQQDTVNKLPLDGSYVVSGPPGTGKTVVALYRAQMMEKRKQDLRMVMYSNLLVNYTGDALAQIGVKGVDVRTYHSWVWRTYKAQYRTDPPQQEDYVYDWSGILERIQQAPPKKDSMSFLIIDEGQDMPGGFFTVASFLARNLTVFADENQRLNEHHNSTLNEIMAAIGNGTREFSLRRNYRNTRQIAQLAATLYTGLPTGIPELPNREGPKPVVRRTRDFDDTVRWISTFENNNRNLEIGVLVPTIKLRNRLHEELARRTRNPVQVYEGKGSKSKKVDFDTPGIKVVCFASAKGLEFDAVFIPELQMMTDTDPTSPENRMLFYVMLSRARDQLFLSWSGTTDKPRIMSMFDDGLVEWRS